MLDNSHDTSVSSNGLHKRDHDEQTCCISGNFHFHSISDALNNISSNNTIVEVRADVVLSSIVTLEGLENITIIGYRNPIIRCNDVGAVKFISCKNVTIEGIQWEGCGSINYPGIEFCKSSDVSFQRCRFHHFTGISVSLSETSENVHVNDCNFTHNEHRGHGAAVHYTPNTNGHNHHNLVIQNCKFISNRATQSVVYIDGSGSMIPVYILMQDNMFINNAGIMVHISHTNLYIRGSVLFKGNRATIGGAVRSENSKINFIDKCEFIYNTVTYGGGAVQLAKSEMFFGIRSVVTFNYNSAQYIGGAIWASVSNITFDGNSSASFNNNEASDDGGAIFCWYSSHITFDGNSNVTFNNNKASNDGGALACVRSSWW